jgi:hypothetical protein
MLFCQLGRAYSLCEICGGRASCEGKLSHLGITAPARATLADANEHRPSQLYRVVFEALLVRCEAAAPARRRFRFKNKLVSLDYTMIELCAEVSTGPSSGGPTGRRHRCPSRSPASLAPPPTGIGCRGCVAWPMWCVC